MKPIRSLTFDERVCRFEYRPHRGDPRKIIGLMKAAGVEVLVASGMHQGGWAAYRSKVCAPHPEMDPRYLPGLVREARRHDIMLLSWYNMAQNKSLARRKTGWEVIKRVKGRFIPEPGSFLCLFSSPYQDFVIEFSKEILDQGFEGLWYDGAWAGALDAPSCYCAYCRKAFRAEYGEALPIRVDWDNPLFREWVRWRYRRFDDFITRLHDALAAHRSDAIVMMNHYNRPHINSSNPSEGTNWRNGVSIDVMRFPGGGGNENTSIMNRLHTTGFNARIVKAQCPQRFDVWEPGGTLWRSVIYGQLENDKTHSILHGVWTLALGGVPWTACTNTITARGRPDPTVMRELKKRRPYMGGEPLTYCAIHYSRSSRDFRGRDNPGAYYTEIYGWYDVAVEGHYLTDLILDGHLENLDCFRRYRVLVLPNSACLSTRQVATLREFVKQGGVLISSFETSLCDEDGQRRGDFALADVFGVRYRKTVTLTPREWGQTVYDRDNVPVETPMLRIDDRNFRRNAARYVFFGANYTRVSLSPGGAVVFASTVKPATTTDALLPGDPLQDTVESPAVVVNRYGRGHSVYFAPEVGRGFLQWPHPETRRLIAQMLDLGRPTLRVKAPKIVEITAFRHKGGNLAVHLVNLPFCTNRPPVPPIGIPVVDEVIPIHDIEVRLRNARASKVTLPISRRKPKVRREGTTLVITVPRVDYHEVIWLE
ncbi:MAG: beta-galactosidase trimerization domain-containing protein [Verrucomicrobia bacterium]|nr:beta-galactosidase trimerization domain-containing protein [Verrucomicrobiota bacterium]